MSDFPTKRAAILPHIQLISRATDYSSLVRLQVLAALKRDIEAEEDWIRADDQAQVDAALAPATPDPATQIRIGETTGMTPEEVAAKYGGQVGDLAVDDSPAPPEIQELDAASVGPVPVEAGPEPAPAPAGKPKA